MTSARYAVFGQPIAHSLSPRIHAAFGAQLGIAIDYRAIEADRNTFAATLAVFARDHGGGANVTSPLKQDALALCTGLSHRARRCGSVNTLVRDGDGWLGDSTDGVGLLRDLARHGLNPDGARVLLLGAGGAARAAAFALAERVGELVIANRTPERASQLAGELDARSCAAEALGKQGPFALVINASAAGHSGSALDLPATLFAASGAAYDLSYARAARAFLAAAHDAGARVAVDGLGMLVEQAAASFALWHGRAPDTSPIHAMLRAET